jgi:hypothetical protein
MCFPIRRPAAIAGVISVLAIALTQDASAGVVTPTEAETTNITQTSVTQEKAAGLPSPVATGDAQQFWYPGMSDSSGIDSISLSNVPVQTPSLAGAGTLAGAQQHPLIPLPMPVWTGMAGLLGLAAAKVARNYRKLLT